MIPEVHIEDYHYDLSDERIAKYPLPGRDSSKLLLYRDGTVSESVFRNLADYLPTGALMVFNETKVVPARLHFVRDTGAHIEIFCLEPDSPAEYNTSFAARKKCSWKCVIGNAKRWKEDLLKLYNPKSDSAIAAMELSARMLSREDRTGVVEFSWKGDIPFSAVLEACGTIPIPPYLGRESEEIDISRYQTTYARIRGSVAAPTAGLHFTPSVMENIARKGIDIQKVCLHVGAGTFLPVKSSDVREHVMHREPFSVSLDLLKRLADWKSDLVAVGTTSVRTLESLYYIGLNCIETGIPAPAAQWAPYEKNHDVPTREAIGAIVDYLERNGLESLETATSIIIVPGFRFRLTDWMVTNFHQSESTLILLVSAFVGGDWRTIYDYALKHDFRFLSYGDSSLLKGHKI